MTKIPMIYDAVNELPIILQPGGSKLSEVYLNYYYTELLATLRRHDVTLLWSYQPRVKGRGQLEPLAGVVRLSRKGFSSP